MKCALCKDKGYLLIRRSGHAKTLPCGCGQKPVKAKKRDT